MRPTARGWQALVIGLLVLFAARLIGTTQLHQLAYALLALLLASLALGLLGSRGLRFTRTLPPGARVTAGTPATIALSLEHARLGASKTRVTDHLPEPRHFDVAPRGDGARTEIPAPLYFARRGVYELGPAEARVADPFGLLGFVHRFEERTAVVVYPRVHALPGFPVRGGKAEAGARGSLGRRGDEFAGLREYRRGDDRRHINWKSVARTGELFVKEFALQAPHRYTVALDLRREGVRAQEDEIEDAVCAAASVLAHLKREGLPFRLVCADKEGSSGGGPAEFGFDEASYWGAMRRLATARADGSRELSDAVLGGRERLGEGVVLVSRTRDEGLPEAVRKLRSAGLPVVVVALATHTYRMPSGAGPTLGQAHNREAEFLRGVGRLEAAGAVVRVVGHPAGVAGLAGLAGPPGAQGANARGAV